MGQRLWATVATTATTTTSKTKRQVVVDDDQQKEFAATVPPYLIAYAQQPRRKTRVLREGGRRGDSNYLHFTGTPVLFTSTSTAQCVKVMIFEQT
ncbi:hypothetical protein V9T40_012634 [Parthenolecanium corni]|uniref:Uncharacterized protein n=1 Tax=Parthenolecanium corni TaxID=536013 RepID=A0AAN9Y0R1_9HEMI